jgi:hypothetical protein
VLVTPRAVRTTASAALTAVPDRRRHLADGILVEASILARLLGLRLLTIHATVVLAPADVTAPSASAARGSPVRRSMRSSGRPPGSLVAGRRGLAEAVRTINEAAELLAEARRDAS